MNNHFTLIFTNLNWLKSEKGGWLYSVFTQPRTLTFLALFKGLLYFNVAILR